MDAEHLRRRCETRLRRIVSPEPFAIETFTDAIAGRRQRSIELVPSAMPPGLHGLLVPEASTDYLFHRADTTPLHRRHIILHELAHLVCGHRGLLIDATSLRDLLARPNGVETLLAQYSREEEREAEMFATLVLARTEGAAPPPQHHDAHAAHALQLLHDLAGLSYGL